VVWIDVRPAVVPDILHDLNDMPWPLPGNSFDEVRCYDVLKHLKDIVAVMEEIHRVGKPGAKVHITTPHFSSANSYTDPTHLHHLGLYSFDYFTGDNRLSFYTGVRFKKLVTHLVFRPIWKNKLIWRLAKRYPTFYEGHLAWIFPAWFMSVELEVVK
jgi:ubiquinone/menaquinone biosynthesis C-methylase UbiE